MPVNGRYRCILLLLFAAILLSSCVVVKPTTSSSRGQGWYTVKLTDTLYSIAWRYGLDYKQLAHWNGVDVNSPIHPGQRLRLVEPASIALGNSSSANSAPEQSGATTSATTTSSSTVKGDDYRGRDPGRWIWPTQGKVVKTFLLSKLDRRGIDIAGESGQPVVAVADGKVVYSGNGLAGYGNLIIIKHSDTYLSAYAYCQERLVEEGMAIKSGKLVAKMGSKDNTAKLYFEIRRNGKPVDPLKYLPKR